MQTFRKLSGNRDSRFDANQTVSPLAAILERCMVKAEDRLMLVKADIGLRLHKRVLERQPILGDLVLIAVDVITSMSTAERRLQLNKLVPVRDPKS